MLAFIRVHRLGLRNMIPSILTVIIRPAVNFRNIARPVSMTGIDRCGPLQRVRPPWIGASYFSSFKNGIEKVENKQQVYGKYNDRYDGYHSVEIIKLACIRCKLVKTYIMPCHTSK